MPGKVFLGRYNPKTKEVLEEEGLTSVLLHPGRKNEYGILT